MNYPQFFIGQKVIYRGMPKDPLTLLTITELNGTSITAQLPGGSHITSDRSSFQRYVPKKEGENSTETPKKKFFKNKNGHKRQTGSGQNK